MYPIIRQATEEDQPALQRLADSTASGRSPSRL